MTPLLLRFLVFLPLIEVVIIVIVWETIGPWWTLGALVGGSLGGWALLRLSPLRTVMGVRDELRRGHHPGPAVVDGLTLGLAGALLLVPGFFTDLLALLLLVGPARRTLFRRFHGDDDSKPPSERPPIEGQFRRDRD